MDRIDWEDLPVAVRNAVEARSGVVLGAVTAPGGVNSGIAATLRVPTGEVFVKGIPRGHFQVRTQEREALIAPYVATISPRLLWHIDTDDWDLLGFEAVRGRHADFTTGSADLPLVADTLRTLAEIPLPDVPLKQLDDRFKDYVEKTDRRWLSGDTLLHTDCAPHNILVTDDRALLIDWAWPTAGPAWADGAYLVTRLVDAGHSPAEADTWALEHLPAWSSASPTGVVVFARACARLWTRIAQDDPRPWKESLSTAAARWSEYAATR
ncbi:phosphotransferase [Embleya sp. NPDC001921]